MPGIGTPIVIGGGIALGTPSVIGNFLKLSSITPPAANTSARLIERSTSVEILGDGTTSTAIGNSADANGTNHIAIGTTVSTLAGSTRQMAIGDNITFPAASGNNSIVIGSATLGVFVGSESVLIGYNATTSTTANSSSVGIGAGITVSGNSSVGIGSGVNLTASGSVAIGASAQAGLNSISIGQLATTGTGGAANSISIGVSSTGPAGVSQWLNIGNRAGAAGTITAGDITLGHQDNSNNVFSLTLWLGGGPDHKASTSVPAFTIKGRQASGSNIGAADTSWLPSRATGNTAGGGITISSTTPAASGSTQQSFAITFRVDPSSNITLAATAGSYGSGSGVVFIGNAITVPTTNPTGGGILYVTGGALTYRGSAGTVTTVAPA